MHDFNRKSFHVCTNERQRYIVTSSLIGRAHTQNDPCIKWDQQLPSPPPPPPFCLQWSVIKLFIFCWMTKHHMNTYHCDQRNSCFSHNPISITRNTHTIFFLIEVPTLINKFSLTVPSRNVLLNHHFKVPGASNKENTILDLGINSQPQFLNSLRLGQVGQYLKI